MSSDFKRYVLPSLFLVTGYLLLTFLLHQCAPFIIAIVISIILFLLGAFISARYVKSLWSILIYGTIMGIVLVRAFLFSFNFPERLESGAEPLLLTLYWALFHIVGMIAFCLAATLWRWRSLARKYSESSEENDDYAGEQQQKWSDKARKLNWFGKFVSIGVIVFFIGNTVCMLVVDANWPIYYIYIMRLSAINDPEQGWHKEMRLIDDMSDRKGMLRAYARWRTMKALRWGLDIKHLWFPYRGQIIRRQAALLEMYRDEVRDYLGTPDQTSDSSDTWTIEDGAFLDTRHVVFTYDSENQVTKAVMRVFSDGEEIYPE